jgi:hypothetical protein
MLEVQFTFFCGYDPGFVGGGRGSQTYVLAVQRFFDVLNPGYNGKLDTRARVLLSGQTDAD